MHRRLMPRRPPPRPACRCGRPGLPDPLAARRRCTGWQTRACTAYHTGPACRTATARRPPCPAVQHRVSLDAVQIPSLLPDSRPLVTPSPSHALPSQMVCLRCDTENKAPRSPVTHERRGLVPNGILTADDGRKESHLLTVSTVHRAASQQHEELAHNSSFAHCAQAPISHRQRFLTRRQSQSSTRAAPAGRAAALLTNMTDFNRSRTGAHPQAVPVVHQGGAGGARRHAADQELRLRLAGRCRVHRQCAAILRLRADGC